SRHGGGLPIRSAVFEERGSGTSERLQLVTRLKGLCRTFTNNYARGHCVAGRYARQDRAICCTKVLDSVHLEFAVNDGHLVSAHFGGTGHVPEARSRIPDEP